MKMNIFILAAFVAAGFGHVFSASTSLSHPPLRQQDTEGDVHGSEGDIHLGIDLPVIPYECNVTITYLVRVPISDAASLEAAGHAIRESKELKLVVRNKEFFLRQMASFFKYYGERVEFKVSYSSPIFDGRKTPERPGTPKGKDFESFSSKLATGLPPSIKITVVFADQASVEEAYADDEKNFAAL